MTSKKLRVKKQTPVRRLCRAVPSLCHTHRYVIGLYVGLERCPSASSREINNSQQQGPVVTMSLPTHASRPFTAGTGVPAELRRAAQHENKRALCRAYRLSEWRHSHAAASIPADSLPSNRSTGSAVYIVVADIARCRPKEHCCRIGVWYR